MRRTLAGKRILDRLNRRIYSAPHPKKPANPDSGGASSSPSSSNYNKQYKALENLDFMGAAKILFSDPPKKKKFGLDFHLVQLFFCCLPSLAVYLVAQYARSEMRKMDAELESKKQAEFEAQAKEMERKAAEEKAAAASNPELLSVKERLDKLEVTMTEIITNSKKHLGEEHNKHKQDAKVEEDNTPTESVGKTSMEGGRVSSEGKTLGLAPDTHSSQSNKKDNKND